MTLHLKASASETGAYSSIDFILRRHDPRLRRCPAPRMGRVLEDRTCAALTWNVFQTLALIPPSFWARRLRARLGGLRPLEYVGVEASVTLWASPHASVIVEAEYDVYGLVTLFRSDLPLCTEADVMGDPLLAAIDSVSRQAGVRDCYVGVITSHPADSPIAASLVNRYANSHQQVVRRLPRRRDGLVNLSAVGCATWGDLRVILEDCARGHVLDDFERYAASRTVRWLDAIGISPVESRSPSSSATTSRS